MELSGTSVEKLFHALTKTTSLDALYLEHNNIPSTACVSIAKTLSKNTSLKVLRLDNNPINDVASLCSIVQSFEPSQKFVRQLGLEGVMKNLGPKLSQLDACGQTIGMMNRKLITFCRV